MTVTKGERTWTRATGGDVAANRMQSHLAALWNWAIQPKRAYADKTPFSYGGRIPEELRKSREHGRDRRLEPGEEAGLLAHAGVHLKDLIVAALETGMRKNELLSLQWRHVRWLQNELALDWRNAKTKRSREIPIAPALREILMRRQQAHPPQRPWTPDHYVFGDEIGERVKDIRTAWDNAVLKARGFTLARRHGGSRDVAERAQLRTIDLNFHDLRHEAGSRKLEAGWPLHARVSVARSYKAHHDRHLPERHDASAPRTQRARAADIGQEVNTTTSGSRSAPALGAGGPAFESRRPDQCH